MMLMLERTCGWLVRAYPSHTCLPHADLDFAYNAEIVAASEDEGEHKVTVPEPSNTSVASKNQLQNSNKRARRLTHS